jgi:hypothetical protein
MLGDAVSHGLSAVGKIAARVGAIKRNTMSSDRVIHSKRRRRGRFQSAWIVRVTRPTLNLREEKWLDNGSMSSESEMSALITLLRMLRVVSGRARTAGLFESELCEGHLRDAVKA